MSPSLVPGRAAAAVQPAREHRDKARSTVSGTIDYSQNAYAMAQGKWLFTQFNCVGCHAHGGGGIGPPLMDDEWIYGFEPQNIFATIVEGRPNGMPAFRGRLNDDQVWQLVTYVRSMSGHGRMDARPGRADHMQVVSPENTRETREPERSAVPAGGQR